MVNRRLGTGFEGLDDDHAATTGRTCELGWLLFTDGLGILSVQETACQSDVFGTVAVSEQAVMADAVEAFGEDVDQEAPDELMDR